MIQLKNVTKKYGSFTAVDDVSFDIDEGEIIGFLGPNGAGKTTTMNMITNFIEPTSGEIYVNGYDMLKKPKKARREIGYMPESTPLYLELTPKEFLNYMADLKLVNKKEKKENVDKVLKQTGLSDVQNKLIRNLSRGYKQRVSLAGALVGNPKILILDEPTVGLDPKQITEIRQLIKSLGKDHTVILSSHILSEISQLCKKIIIINKGKILAIDSPENIENKTKEKNIIIITVEDKEGKMLTLSNEISDTIEISLEKDNEDGTKTYIIKSNKDEDLRKKMFEICSKEDITIFEMKKAETTLEEAFVKLIDEDYNKKEEIKNVDNNEKRD